VAPGHSCAAGRKRLGASQGGDPGSATIPAIGQHQQAALVHFLKESVITHVGPFKMDLHNYTLWRPLQASYNDRNLLNLEGGMMDRSRFFRVAAQVKCGENPAP
jgi:hypothetical protein